jgi:GNAT superfamily N-acetyltransferase
MSQPVGMLPDRSSAASEGGEEVDVRIERWTGEDLPEAIVDLLRRTMRILGMGQHELEVSLRIAAADHGLAFVASDDAGPVGVLIAARDREIDHAFVRWLVVDEAHRRRSVGTALVEALAATPGITRLSGMVDQDDPVASNFWRSSGWTVPSPRAGRRRQFMHRDLAPAVSDAA